MTLRKTTRGLVAIALLGLALGCSGDREPAVRTAPSEAETAAETPEPTETPEPAPAETAAEAEAPDPLAPREVGSLRITPAADGTIHLEGTDRWGGEASTTYESVDFLEPALPILERSLTAEQVEALREIATALRAGATPPAAAEEAPAETPAETAAAESTTEADPG